MADELTDEELAAWKAAPWPHAGERLIATIDALRSRLSAAEEAWAENQRLSAEAVARALAAESSASTAREALRIANELCEAVWERAYQEDRERYEAAFEAWKSARDALAASLPTPQRKDTEDD